MESDDLAQFASISKMVLENKQLWKKGTPGIINLQWWTITCKKNNHELFQAMK